MSAAVFRDLADAGRHDLDVAVDLTLSHEGEEVTIESYTDRVFVTVPSVAMVLRGFRRHRRLSGGLSAVLAGADLTLVVRVGGTDVALLGADADPGGLGRRLVPGVELRPAGLALALVDDLA